METRWSRFFSSVSARLCWAALKETAWTTVISRSTLIIQRQMKSNWPSSVPAVIGRSTQRVLAQSRFIWLYRPQRFSRARFSCFGRNWSTPRRRPAFSPSGAEASVTCNLKALWFTTLGQAISWVVVALFRSIRRHLDGSPASTIISPGISDLEIGVDLPGLQRLNWRLSPANVSCHIRSKTCNASASWNVDTHVALVTNELSGFRVVDHNAMQI